MTQKEAIIFYFQEMDISMLELILSDKVKNSEWDKQLFLKNIENTFWIFKQAGDTKLIPHKGFCKSYSCDNKGCSGYSFVGNNSHMHLDIIFDESKLEVQDIFDCRSLKTSLFTDELNLLIPIQSSDNYIDLSKSDINEIVDNYNTCFSLLDEIVQLNKKGSILKKDCLNWVHKADLIKEYLPKTKIDNPAFDKLFGCVGIHTYLLKLILITKYDAEIENALEEYKQFKKSEELKLLLWLVKYQELNNIISEIYLLLNSTKTIKGNSSLIIHNIMIDSKGYENVIYFYIVFNKYYSRMLKKHNSFTEHDQIKFMSGDDELNDKYLSLKYHLKRKGIIE